MPKRRMQGLEPEARGYGSEGLVMLSRKWSYLSGRSDGNEAMLPYKRIVAPMLSERLYRGIGEKSIGYPRKVYRVFPESLQSIPKKSIEYSEKVYRVFSDGTVQRIRYFPSSAPVPSYKRSVPSHSLPQYHLSFATCLRTDAPSPPMRHSRGYE